VSGKRLFLLGVFRRRLEYPALKRAVREQQSLYDANVVLIEDKASGTQLIQELIRNGCHGVTRYQPTLDKVMRLHAQTAMIENGFVHIPPGRFHRPVPGLVQNANAELGHLRGNPQRC
jgi:predicted phage terminase large subunit-like protein